MHILNKLVRLAAAVTAAAGVAVPATPVAAATKTICVGLVVDARPLGGPVSADCTSVPDGSTGYDVLRAGGHTVSFRQDGLICTIDNRPADGCAATDAQHFWAYFHRDPKSSSWQYSDEGASTYKPSNGATEGWVWRDGDDATPKNIPYSTICPQSASPSPRPATTTQPARVQPSPTAAVSTEPTAPSETRRPRRPAPASTSTSRTSQPSTASPSPTTVAALVDDPHDQSSGPPWGLISAAVVIAGFGGAAVWRWRRRGSD